MSGIPADARAAAATVLAGVLGGQSLNQALPAALAGVTPRDRGFLQELCFGTLRQGPRLQAVLDALLDKPLRERDRDIQGLLLAGLYQLDGMRVPDHAAVAATVDATAALRKQWAQGLVNAVLRRYLRERDALVRGLDAAAAAAHPAWLYHEIKRQWPAASDAIIAAGNEAPPMTLRVNGALGSRRDYLHDLALAGIAARPGALGADAVYLAQPADVAELPGFAEGRVSVQDEAAQLAAPLLAAGTGMRVLDACAAPGGKSCHLLEQHPDLAELVAMDIDAQRLQRVADNLRRLGLQAHLLCGDAARPPVQLAAASFDRILVDAPCSATGVIRRHPDVKLLRRASDPAGMVVQQLSILGGLWPLLRPGGELLYATCSILGAENDGVVAQFLERTGDAQLLPMQRDWGEPTACGRQLLPAPAGHDGLYYARLRKQG